MLVSRHIAQLMQDVAAGDHQAFEQLVLEHQQEVRLFVAARASNWDLVEEVAQNTFVRAYQYADRYDPNQGTVQAWLKGIAWNCLREELRSRSRHQHSAQARIDASLAALALAEADERDQHFTEDRLARLRSCLDTLSPRARELLKRRYQDNIAINTLAQQFRKKANAIAGSLRRIRLALKECIDKGATSDA